MGIELSPTAKSEGQSVLTKFLFEGIKAGLTLNVSDEFFNTLKDTALYLGK